MSDFKDWDNFIHNLRTTTVMDDYFDDVTEEVIDQLQDDTPVDTGHLKSMWTSGNPNTESYVKSLPTYKAGDNMTHILENKVDYGFYVNYGHKQQPGRYVPQIHARLVRDYIPGTYFLESSLNNMNLKGTKAGIDLKIFWEDSTN